ncbi:MAG: hypothetical protein HY258_09875 [Chloroflexi bacterium]|nr:hypothetical protein [Chloroflexota bacterium]
MKNSSRVFLLAVVLLAALAMSACGGAAPAEQASKAPHVFSDIVFTGPIEAINGNQWTINGQTITVDPSVVHGTFNVGDTVTVEANVAQDGTVTVNSVDAPEAVSTQSPETETQSPDVTETPDVSSTEAPSVTETPDASQNGEAVGVVTAVDASTITVDGVVYNLADFTEIKGTINVGDTVKIEFVTNADGTLTITEVKASSSLGSNDNGNSNEDNQNGNSNENSNESEDGGGNSNGNSNSNGSGGGG